MDSLFDYIISPYKTYETWQILLEAIATILGIASVFCSMRRNIWVYPTGIISTLLYIYLYFSWGLYGETLINVYFTVMSIYGWILWFKNTEADHIHVKVEWATKKDYFKASALFIVTFLFILCIYYYRPLIDAGFDFSQTYEFKHHYTIIDFLDASITGLFLIGMWLMAKRKIDNWIFWIIGDFTMIPLLLYKGYAISSFQYLIFTILAISALILWKKDYQKSLQNS